MTDLDVYVLLALTVTLYLVGTGILSHRAANRYRKVARTERTRACWIAARHRLFELVVEGKLDIRSATFLRLNQVQTFIVRNPGSYTRISGVMADAFLAPTEEGLREDIAAETGDWPDEMRDVFVLMGKGTASLIFLHRGWLKFVPIAIGFGAWLLTRAPGHVGAALIQRVVGPTVQLSRTRARFNNLSHA